VRSPSTSALPATALAAVGWAFVILGGPGCAGAPTDLTEGQRCLRTAQCLDGLVCSPAGMCTADVTGMGMVPPPPPADAQIDAEIDAGLDVDGGPVPDIDSGPEIDGGPSEIDAFVPPEVDAFVPPEVDAFVPPEVDAFMEIDAFVEVDAPL
jgi:hypothetical protein